MKYLSVLGWGIVIYAVMYLAWSGLVLYGFSAGLLPRLFAIGILILPTTLAAHSLKFASWIDILPHSIGWMVIVALLDMVFSVPYSGWQLYADWNVWVGYALVAGIPLLAPLTKPRAHVEAE